jgi:tripartite ATP-independent transporter DctP family solute receptor
MRSPLPLAGALLFLLVTPAAHGEDAVVAKLATVAPEGTPWAEQLQEFKKRIEKDSAGKMKIKAFLGGNLGDENVTASETKRGAIQLWAGSTGALASIVPEMGMFELPYLFRDTAEADFVLDEVVQEDMKKLLGSRGFTLVFWAENGWRNYGTKFGAVKTPADLKGKKMRSQESDVHIRAYQSVGAVPVPIAVTEVLSSLQTGVVDGFDNTPLFSFAASWHQGIKHYSLTEHIYQPAAIVANKAWFDGLPADLKKALLGDPKAEAVKGRKGVRQLAPLLLENFKAAGIEVHPLSAEQKVEFAKLMESVHGTFIKGKGKGAAAMFDKTRKALAERRKKK